MADATLHVAEPPERVEPTTELIREALEETRELVRLEVAMAREEFKTELAQAKQAGIAFGAAGGAGIVAFAMFMVAIAAAFSWMWLAALIIGAILLALSGALALAGWKTAPTRPLPETRERLESDWTQLKERAA